MPSYTFRFQDLTRELPVYTVESGLKIAYLDTLSDVQLVTALSREMAKIIAKNQAFCASKRVVLFTAEAKGIPFAFSVAEVLSREFGEKTVELAIARKSEKKFFGKCISARKTSITSGKTADMLYLPEYDAEKLRGAKVVLLDDFYSTGASMNALGDLAVRCGADVIERVVAVWETVDGYKPPVAYVATLPIIG